jgi:nucleoside-diphosphate-sugar epimerase
MHVVITGGAGFLGVRLARTLLQMGKLSLIGAPEQAIRRITLVDRATAPADLLCDHRVQSVVGDLSALLQPQNGATAAIPADTDLVFHLAAAVSGECEADFDLGLRSNLDATRALLQACRALNTQPTVVFASSLAVFGNSPEQPLPAVIQDNTLPTPQNSYGIQKFMGEQLVADYGRKGFVHARNLRLMTVSVRPGKPNGAASSFLSGMIREPLAGQRGACPVAPETAVALASAARTIEGLICAAQTSDAAWGPRTALNLPALTTTAAAMAAALQQVAGKTVRDLIDWTPDEAIARIVTSWPSRIDAARARALGLLPDTDFVAIVRDYVRENPDAVRVGTQP